MYVGNVRNKDEAQAAIAALLDRFAGETAMDRLEKEARYAKQNLLETTWRVAGNVLNSLVTRKPEGFVEFP